MEEKPQYESISDVPTGSTTDESRTPCHSDSTHEFDLHGCMVFDDFVAVSYIMGKGLLGPLLVISPENLLRHIGEPPETLTGGLYASPALDISIESVPTDAQPSIFVLPIQAPVTVLEDFAKHTKRFHPERNTKPSSKLRHSAGKFIDLRRQWVEKLLKPSPHLHVTNVETFPLKQDDQYIPKHEDEYTEEIDHVSEFLRALESDNKSESSSIREETILWLNDVSSLLQRSEDSGSLAIVLLLEIPFDGDDQAKYEICQNIVECLPNRFRRELQMPAIICGQSPEKLRESITLISQGVHKAVITPIRIRPGDHIYREIRETGGLRYVTHHGLYTGNGRVIHFSGNESSLRKLLFGGRKHAKIRVTTINKFMKHGLRLKVRKYSKVDSIEVTIDRAESALVDQTFPEYNLFSNNCEHFVCWCKTGKSKSKQVEKGVQYTAIAGAVLLTTVALGTALATKKR